MFFSFKSFLSFLLGFFIVITPASANSLITPKFIENKGQILNQNFGINKDVLYMCDFKGLKIQLRKSGYSYELYQINNLPVLEAGKKNIDVKKLTNTKINSYRIDVEFLDMNLKPEIVSGEKGLEVSNYVFNNNEVDNIASFNKVTYKNIYQFTDIEFVLTGNETSPFKYNIILHPGADINKIKFLCKGASSIVRSNNGSINFNTPLGVINENIPFSFYTELPSKNENIEFKLVNNVISFSGKYDNTKTLIIDPSSNRIWGTYFGGPSLDFCTSTTVDALNNVFIAGYSLSTSNIATAGAYQTVLNGSYDAYLAKFNSAGALLWSTYYGGTGFDIFYNLYVDVSGNIYACGDSNSPSNIASIGAHQTVYGGGIDDGIIVKFDTNGQRLWSTYYGGNQHEIINGITTDGNGDLVVAGHTESSGSISTPGAYNTAYTFSVDVFVVKFNSSGVRQWGTYYGDNNGEEPLSADCDAANNIYISGFTTSSAGMATPGSHQTVYGGNQDGFIAKFNPGGSQLLWATYYGGGGIDNVPKVQLDNSGNIFIGGNTTSATGIASAVAHQTVLGSSDDGFLAKFNSAGVRQWATYFGGNDVDYVSDFLLDANNNIVFCGETESTNDISTAGAYQTTLASVFNYDAYIAKFSSNGVQKLGTYFGGLNNDNARAITMDNTGLIYIAGETNSSNAIASAGSYMPLTAGNGDAFLAKFCLAPEPVVTPANSATVCASSYYSYSTQFGYTSYLWTGGATTSSVVANTGSTGTFYYSVNVSDAYGCNATSDSVKLFVSACTFIEELENELSVNLFPVPSSDFIQIDFKKSDQSETVNIQIFSTIGELISSFETNENQFKTNVSQLSSGLYILRIKIDQKIIEQKFIKE